ncbi:hypothetical protein [Pseudomonas citronellolis]|uniref:hypothetical protein n=1 Tax=Pseudomonas citronellolis TaxID=53408 RepID=UPI000A7DD53B|nr:hypothetical protein [Pseudomonas citronellolis]
MYQSIGRNWVARPALAMILGMVAQLGAETAEAHELYNEGDTSLDFNFTAMYAWLTSQESYFGKDGRSTWQEGYAKYGLSGATGLAGGGLYGGIAGLSSATWGAGDAGGNTSGDEDDTTWEDAFVGWKSGDLLPALGKDGLDVSLGRQGLIIGDGFVIKNDGLAYGQPYGDHYDRGGAYYLAARQSFDKTAIVRLGGDKGLRADLAWVHSDNPGQSETEFALANIEHVGENGTLAFMHLRGLDVDDKTIFTNQLERDGLKLYSLRGTRQIDDLFLSGEYVIEDKRNAATAGYAEAGYTLSGLPWSPTVSYRYARFSKHYDAMFTGYKRGYGTWVQGEVAGNYAGPFNTNTRVHHVGIKASPSESLTVGALYFDFKTLDTELGNTDARELDFYLEWFPTPSYYISPTIGLYDPRRDLASGGTQTADDKLSTYAQVTFGVFF